MPTSRPIRRSRTSCRSSRTPTAPPSLVRHLLAFSRKQTLRPQVLDLGEVLCDLTMLLRRLIGEKVTLNVVHGRDLWPVKVDIVAVRAGDRQSRGQCPRRHARRRQAASAHRQCHGRGVRALSTPRACRPPTTCWSRSPTPAPASRRRSSTRSSSRSSRPRKSARAPGSASPRSTASSSRPAASSMSTPP